MFLGGSRQPFCFLSHRVFEFFGAYILDIYTPDMCPGRLAESLHELCRLQCCSVLFQRLDCFSFWGIPVLSRGDFTSAPLFSTGVRPIVFHRCPPQCFPQMSAPLFSTDVRPIAFNRYLPRVLCVDVCAVPVSKAHPSLALSLSLCLTRVHLPICAYTHMCTQIYGRWLLSLLACSANRLACSNFLKALVVRPSIVCCFTGLYCWGSSHCPFITLSVYHIYCACACVYACVCRMGTMQA